STSYPGSPAAAASERARSTRHDQVLLTPSNPTKPEVTSSANPSTVSDNGTDVSSTCAYIRSSRDTPMRAMLRSADSLIALADRPSISITDPSAPTNPA